jgi:hypothetical protein
VSPFVESVVRFADSGRSRAGLFVEEFGLVGGGASAGRLAAGDSDDAENLDFGEGGAGNENPEIIAIEIGRSEPDAVVEEIEEVARDDAFEFILIAEAKANPEPVELGTAEEGFALGLERFGQILDEIDALDFGQRQGLEFAVLGEELGSLAVAEGTGIEIARDARAVGEEHDGLLVRGSWG